MKINATPLSTTAAMFFVAALSPSPVYAQLSIPDRLAQNTCWYMSKGQTFSAALQFAYNPVMLLLDERGITPGYVVQNGQYILRDLDSYKESVGSDAALNQSLRRIISRCRNRLSREEYNAIIREINGNSSRKTDKQRMQEIARKKEQQRKQEVAREQARRQTGVPWWIARNQSLIGKRTEFRTDVALKRYNNPSSSEDYSGHSRSGDWRAYGKAKVNWSEWKRDGNYLMAPFISKSGHSITIAVDCSDKTFNYTHPKNNEWMGWMSGPSLNVALKTLVKDVCSVYG